MNIIQEFDDVNEVVGVDVDEFNDGRVKIIQKGNASNQMTGLKAKHIGG